MAAICKWRLIGHWFLMCFVSFRTEYYLEQLADTMVLRLSSTRPSATKARKSAKLAAAAATSWGTAAEGSSGARKKKASPSLAAADDKEKEEMS